MDLAIKNAHFFNSLTLKKKAAKPSFYLCYNGIGMSDKDEPKRIKIDPEEIKRLLAIIYKARGTK